MAEPAHTPKSPLWMRITLFFSLALNLLIAGLAAGFVLFASPGKQGDRPPREIGTIFTRALEPADRRALRREFMSGLATAGREQEGVEAGLRNVLNILRATPFDPEAFGDALAQQSDRRKQRDEIGRSALAARIEAMSDTQRAAYADRVEADIQELAKRLRR